MKETEKRIAGNISYLDFLTKENDVSCNKLEIANFQRNYVWKAKNIKALFDSIENSDINDSTYLGNLVIQRTKAGNIGRDFVVDGQQRLLTLSLIVKAIYSIKRIKGCRDIIFFDKNKPRIKLSRKTLNKTYSSIINDEKILLNNIDGSQEKFLKNYKDIWKRLKKIDDINLFFKKINKIEFVVIKCPSVHDVNQLFESLNSKGEKLSSVQLSKNAILSGAKIKDETIEKINSKWEKIESGFEKKDSKIIWFDKFFRHRWFCIDGYVPDSGLFDAVKKSIKVVGVENFTNKLEEDSEIYLSLRRGDLGSKNKYSESASDPKWRNLCLMIEFIQKMNVDQVYSVLLAIIKYGKINKDYFEKLFFNDVENIWKFLVLMKYSKKFNPNSYERIFAKFCKDIHNIPAEKNFNVVRKEFFESLFLLVPKQDDFSLMLNEKIVCKDIDFVKKDKQIIFHEDRDVIRSLLLIYITDGDRIISSEKETIEHIIPKGDISKWTSIKEEYRDAIEKTTRYKFGNLTMLEKKLNSSKEVGNSIFDIKFEKAYKNSHFFKNKNLYIFRKKFNSENPEKAVFRRGNLMANVIYSYLVKVKV